MLRRTSLQEPELSGGWAGEGALSVHSLYLPYFKPASLVPGIFHQTKWPPACTLLSYPSGILHAVASGVWEGQAWLYYPLVLPQCPRKKGQA